MKTPSIKPNRRFLVAIAIFSTGCGSNGKPSKPAPEAIPVRVAQAIQVDVPVEVSAIGYGEPLATVTLRPQVEGQVDQVLFKEGQFVEAGEPLILLDNRPSAAPLPSAG